MSGSHRRRVCSSPAPAEFTEKDLKALANPTLLGGKTIGEELGEPRSMPWCIGRPWRPRARSSATVSGCSGLILHSVSVESSPVAGTTVLVPTLHRCRPELTLHSPVALQRSSGSDTPTVRRRCGEDRRLWFQETGELAMLVASCSAAVRERELCGRRLSRLLLLNIFSQKQNILCMVFHCI
jgi:hypothetical protein